MFTIDFTKPWLYKDIIYFNQGNLSTNNTLRCKLVTGGSDDFTGGSIACTFTNKNSVEISGFGKLIDAKNGIIDIVFPSNSLVVGTNKLEILVNRADGGVAQSPPVMYDIWQGLTTGNGIEAETNYPILIQLINSTNEASNKANSALNKANSMITDMTDAIDNAYRSANEADIATSNANTKIEEVETAKTEMIKKVDTSIVTMKSEVETTKNEMVSKTDEKIADIDRALAAGTVDLEVKQARKDASGVVYDNLKQMLDANLGVEGKTLKDLVIDMNNMKEMQDLEYETDKGYAVCEKTGNGTVKDLKIYGKSVINVLPKLSTLGAGGGSLGQQVKPDSNGVFTGISSNSNYYIYDGEIRATSLLPNSTYTTKGFIEINCETAGTINLFYVGTDKTNVIKSYKLNAGVTYLELNEMFSTNALCNGMCGFYTNGTGTVNSIKYMFMMIQGDVRQLNIPSYIDGIVSVGNGNEIEVLSCDNVNLCIGKVTLTGNSKESILIDNFIIESVGSYFVSFNTITPYKGNSIYLKSISKSYARIVGTVSVNDGLAKGLIDINQQDLNIILSSNDARFEIYRSNGDVVLPSNVMLNRGNYYIPYVDPKVDKKTPLYKDTDGSWKPILNVRGIDENNCDIVDTVNNVFTKKYLSYTFNGTESWKMINTDPNSDQNQLLFSCSFITNSKPGGKCISDKFIRNDVPYSFNGECFIVSHKDGTSYIRINKNRLSTQDLQGFKTWLQSNNVTVVYELNQPQQYEINPIYPEAFEDETLMLFKTGPISPRATWKITSNLPNFVKELSKQVRQLQDQVYKTNVANFTVALNTLDTKLRLDRLEAPQQ